MNPQSTDEHGLICQRNQTILRIQEFNKSDSI